MNARRHTRTTIRTTLAVVAVTAGALAGATGAGAGNAPAAADVPPGFTLFAANDVVGEGVVDVATRPGDAGLYVVSQFGRITRVDEAGSSPVADFSASIVAGGEQGLLGLAFSADGSLAYVNYTEASAGDTVIAELAVADDAGVVTLDPAAQRVLLTIDQPYPNHNGGDILVGPDEMLYIPTGDGGSGSDPERYAQNLDSLLGKLLRIDPTPDAASGTEYTIPTDNPYVGTADARGEIWAIGLRNPWRAAFDATTGDLWIADVGQGEIEEIDVAPATDGAGAARDANFGWSALEGDLPHNTDVELTNGVQIDPVFTYDHSAGGCSVSGGVRAREAAAPALEGTYVFADYCTATVYVLAVDGEGEALAAAGDPVEHQGPSNPTSVTQGADGHVYVSASGGLYRFEPTA